MKKIRLSALLCAVLIVSTLLAGCSNGPTVATVAGEAVTAKELNMFANFLLMQKQAGITLADIDDADMLNQVYTEALDNAIMYKMLMKKGIERKLYPLTEEKRKEIDDQITQYMDSVLQEKIDQYTQQGDPNAEKKARKDVYASMEKSGLNRQNLTLILRYLSVGEIIYNETMDPIQVSDEELQAGYAKRVAEQKEQFTADPAAYEDAMQMTQYGGPQVLYRPEGYRYVKHILIAFPKETADKIQEAQSSGDTEGVKKLREEALPLIKTKADEVLAKVQAGGDFDSLMAEFGEDPGMQQEPASQTGYELGQGTNFVPEFKEAALKLAKVGDVTSLVATDFGYHIIKWVGNVPSGPYPLEDVKDALQEELLAAKQEAAWQAFMDQLKTEYKVQEFKDKFPTLAPATSAPAATATAQG